LSRGKIRQNTTEEEGPEEKKVAREKKPCPSALKTKSKEVSPRFSLFPNLSTRLYQTISTEYVALAVSETVCSCEKLGLPS